MKIKPKTVIYVDKSSQSHVNTYKDLYQSKKNGNNLLKQFKNNTSKTNLSKYINYYSSPHLNIKPSGHQQNMCLKNKKIRNNALSQDNFRQFDQSCLSNENIYENVNFE